MLFGSFSKEDVHDLFKNTTSDLHFVWQDRAANQRCASFGNNLVVQTTAFGSKGGCSPGVLSPNIPPNPPTSPVEGNYDTSNRGGLASKLNVNAIPFVPATLSAIVPDNQDSLGVTKNNFTQQLTFPSSATTDTDMEGRHQLPGVVVQTIGEPSSTTRLESSFRDIESDSHSSEQSTNSTAQQVAQTSEKHSNDCEHSKPPPSTLHLDLSTVQQLVDPPQRTQPCSTSPDSTHTGSHSCSVSSDTGRQHDVVAQTKPHPPPSSRTSTSESRSGSQSPTSTPHVPTSPSHTLVPLQSTNSPSPSSSTANVKDEVASSQGALQQPPVYVTQSSSQSASPGSVSSLSTASATSTVPSSASSSASGSGGVKLKSWASIVGKKSSEPVGQASQTSSATSPHVQTVPSSSIAAKRGGDETSSHDLHVTVTMATDSHEGGDETQKQFPPLNPAQLANLGSMS